MDGETKHRARSMDEFREGQRKFGEAAIAARDSAPPFAPRPSDIIISPYGKCGTTFLQQMFHTLRTGGDSDFDDISRVVPWIELSPLLGLDLNAEQRANPRGFKSHLSFTSVPKGARYLVSLRDPRDAFVSMYRFMTGWFIEPGAISMEDFFDGWRRGGAEGEGYWGHLSSWWAMRESPDVLLFSYAKMVRDRAAHARRLAEFARIPADDALIALVADRTSRDYMLANKTRFDDAMMRAMSEDAGGLPPGSDSAKVRPGASGSHREELPPAIAEEMDAIWAETIEPALGFRDFAELEAAL